MNACARVCVCSDNFCIFSYGNTKIQNWMRNFSEKKMNICTESHTHTHIHLHRHCVNRLHRIHIKYRYVHRNTYTNTQSCYLIIIFHLQISNSSGFSYLSWKWQTNYTYKWPELLYCHINRLPIDFVLCLFFIVQFDITREREKKVLIFPNRRISVFLLYFWVCSFKFQSIFPPPSPWKIHAEKS